MCKEFRALLQPLHHALSKCLIIVLSAPIGPNEKLICRVMSHWWNHYASPHQKKSEVREAFRKRKKKSRHLFSQVHTHTHTEPGGVLSISVQEIVSSTSLQIWICELVISSATGIKGFSIQWYWLKQLLLLGVALIILQESMFIYGLLLEQTTSISKETSVLFLCLWIFLMQKYAFIYIYTHTHT